VGEGNKEEIGKPDRGGGEEGIRVSMVHGSFSLKIVGDAESLLMSKREGGGKVQGSDTVLVNQL